MHIEEVKMEAEFEAQVKFSDEEFLNILDLMQEVAEALAGKQSRDPRLADTQMLALKLFNHACSVRELKNGLDLSLPLSGRQISKIDIASIAAINRAALDTYLTFYEVFLEPKNGDEFEFAYCLWYLAGYTLVEDIEDVNKKLEASIEAAKKTVDDFRTRIKQTKVFQSLTLKQQKKALRGERTRNWNATLSGAEFGSKTFRTLYKHSSGYVHADAKACVQIMNTRLRTEQIEFAETDLTLTLILLSKFILRYSELHSESKQVIDRYPKILNRVIFWSNIASGMN
jgi:hypothetical protein